MTENNSSSIESEYTSFSMVQQIYECQSWKMYHVDNEYLAHFYIGLSMIVMSHSIEELMIAFDLHNLSFIYDEEFMKFMHMNAIEYVNSSVERNMICEATRDDYVACFDKMKMKLWAFFLNT